MSRLRVALLAAIVGALLVGIVAYSWWATGQRPFAAPAYLACGVPIVAILLATGAAARGRSARPRSGAGEPPAPPHPLPRLGAAILLGLLLVALALEVAGLAVGGRSKALPTLSTVADELTATHAARFVAFLLWLAAGGALARTRRPAGRAPRRPSSAGDAPSAT